MRLHEIAEKIGVPVVDLNSGSINAAAQSGKISNGEAQLLLSALKKADGIWENNGAPVAKHLW